MKKLCIAVALTAFLTGCGATSSGGGSGESAGQPDMKVEASKIIKEFEQNEAKADSKYKGKTLQVSGVVSKVDTEIMDDSQYVIMLNGGGPYEFLNVNCNDIPSKVAGKVKNKKPLTVVGKFDDGGDLGIELANCRVA